MILNAKFLFKGLFKMYTVYLKLYSIYNILCRP